MDFVGRVVARSLADALVSALIGDFAGVLAGDLAQDLAGALAADSRVESTLESRSLDSGMSSLSPRHFPPMIRSVWGESRLDLGLLLARMSARA